MPGTPPTHQREETNQVSNTESRTFPLGVILSVTTGIVLAEIGDVHEFLDFMTGDQLLTHQLPRASEECKEPLLQQFPQLEGVQVPPISDWAECEAFLKYQGAIRGSFFEVRPLDPDDHTSIDPLVELKQMTDAPIIAVRMDGEA